MRLLATLAGLLFLSRPCGYAAMHDSLRVPFVTE